MLMQCAITSGLRRPRNLSLSCWPPGLLPPLQEGGVFSTWGGGGGGEAEASSGLPRKGRQQWSPLPRRVGEGGREGEHAQRERERAPARGADREVPQDN